MDYKRILQLNQLLTKKSFFLFGPRATGKSYLIDQQLKNALLIDLLNGQTFLRLNANPNELENMVSIAHPESSIIVIDEIQKSPQLLDEVHRLIERKKYRFLLTGSSARKLKTGAVNLLAGRAWQANLFPLVYAEISNFSLDHYLRYGGLPTVVNSKYPDEELKAYVKTYLYEEIRAEGIVRKLPLFSRFIQVAALSNSELINFSNISSDSSVAASTVREYYSILEDTLIGFLVKPWLHSKKRKAIATSKFYFFDIGLVHTLCGTKTLDRNSDLYGQSFEHWVGLELRAYLSYRRKDDDLCFWRSVNGQEVDFVIGDSLAIEVKASKKISSRELKGLKALQEENKIKRFMCISHDPIKQKINGIDCWYWKDFMESLWQDELFFE